jgi:hypothetical protein
VGISVKGRATVGLRFPGEGSISQEVRPEDKMATDSQNGDIITLSVLFLITFTKKSVLKSRFLFCQDNCQRFLVLQVDPKIYQDSRNLLKHREARDS